MKRTWELQSEFADARIYCFTWYQYSSCLQVFALLRFDIVKSSICIVSLLLFLYFRNPSGSYLTFVGATLEYPHSLHYNRSSWSELRYLLFKASLKLWWRLAWDFDGSQISVTSGGIQSSSRSVSFEIAKLRGFLCVTIFTVISNMNYC